MGWTSSRLTTTRRPLRNTEGPWSSSRTTPLARFPRLHISFSPKYAVVKVGGEGRDLIVNALRDTGSEDGLITPELAAAVGARSVGRRVTHTATGSAELERVEVEVSRAPILGGRSVFLRTLATPRVSPQPRRANVEMTLGYRALEALKIPPYGSLSR